MAGEWRHIASPLPQVSVFWVSVHPFQLSLGPPDEDPDRTVAPAQRARREGVTLSQWYLVAAVRRAFVDTADLTLLTRTS